MTHRIVPTMRAQMTPRISTVLDDANLSHDALVKGSELIAVSSCVIKMVTK